MMLIRPVRTEDLATLEQFATAVAHTGLTTLPANTEKLKKNIEHSLQSFEQSLAHFFWLVLEDLTQQQVVGCCAITSHVGRDEPFYSYKISHISQQCQALNITQHHPVLHLVNDYRDVTEIGTLFLTPEYRQQHNGKLLSKSRFILMAQFPQLFNSVVIADMRGYLDHAGFSPFWQALGQNFFGMNFSRADYLSAISNKQFIADLMPTYPIYSCLLPQEAQSVIGLAHPTSRKAQSILEQENFKFNHYIDIFDAGPTLETSLHSIRTIQNSHIKTISAITALTPTSSLHLIATIELSRYRVTLAATHSPTATEIHITPETADILNVKVGNTVRIASFQ